MAADTTRLNIELITILRGLQQTLRGLDRLKIKLDSLASIKLNQQQSSGIDKAALATQRLVLQQQRLLTQTQELANRQERARQATERLAQSQARLAQVQERAARASSRVGLGASQDAHVREFRFREAAARRSAAEVARINAQTQRQAEQQERLRANAARVLGNVQVREAKRGADAIIASLNRQSHVVEQATRHLNTLSAAALRVGGGLRSLGLTASVTLTAPLVALATIATRNAVEFDSLRRGLEVIAGTSVEAAVQLERLKEIAKAPGIGFQEAIQGSIRLQAVGFSARDAEKALVQFANAVALTGGGREELSRVTVQLGQLAAKGKVVAQDLKPIIEAAPAVGQALLQAFGTVNSEDIQKLGLSSQEFFDQLTDALSKLPRAAAGAKNSFENFSDSLFRASLALGDATLPPLQKIAEFVEPIITALAERFRQLPESVQLATVAFGALVAAIGPILFIIGGLASGIGAIGTAVAALLPILSTIGLPAILATLAGFAIVITEVVAAVAALGLAWETNFLNIRGLVEDARRAIVDSFNRIKLIFAEATARILPSLSSITRKVLGLVSQAWETYGVVVVRIVGESFRFVLRVTETFLRAFTDFVDLVLKLIDADWRGAWQAFARIVIGAIEGIGPALVRLQVLVGHALLRLNALILEQIARFAIAAQKLAIRFIAELAAEIIRGVPKIRAALEELLILAATQADVTSSVAILIGKFLGAAKRAASEGVTIPVRGEVGGDVSIGEGILRKRGLRPPSPTDSGAGRQQRAVEREARRLRDAQDKLAEQELENRITLTRAGIEQQFTLTKDGLDRESRLLDNAFEDRLKSVRAFFAERKRIQEAEIDAEMVKEKALNSALADEFRLRRQQIETEFQSALTDIDEDSRLKGRARDLARQTAETKKQADLAKAHNEFETASAEISTRILTLGKARADVAREIARAEAELTRELQKQRNEVRFSLFEEQGRTADAEAGRLKQRFTDTLRELRIDLTGLPLELQNAINGVDLSTLQQQLDQLPEPIAALVELLDIGIKRAQIAEAQRFVDDLSAGLRLDEQRIQNRVLDGLISQREAQAQIIQKQREYRGVLLDVLQGELAKAEAIKDQSVILAIQQQIEETKRLGIEIDEVGQQINQAFLSDIQSGISGIFSGARKGFEGLRDAAISFGERLLDTLNDIAATSIVKQLEGLFKPDATNTQGTVGGFFSKLFGLQPKQQADAAAASATLSTGAATASATLSTGVTTAAASFGTTVITSATSFAATILSAAAGFAAAIAASSAAQGISQGIGGLGSALGGAATGIFPAVDGGMLHIVEGGYPEAVLTTDPKYATRQVAILKAFLKETRGLGGRIRGLAAGGFSDRIDISTPNIQLSNPGIGELAIAGTPSTMKFRQVLVDQRDLGNWVNSSEGEQVLVDFLYKHAPVVRKIGGKN